MPRMTKARTQTREDLRAYGRMGGLTCVAKHGGEAMTLPMRRGRWASFERQVLEADPGLRERNPAELQTRAKALEDAHMEKMRAKLRAKQREKAEEKALACPNCCAERGKPAPKASEAVYCSKHAKQTRRAIKASAARLLRTMDIEQLTEDVLRRTFPLAFANAAPVGEGDGDRAA